MCVTTKRGHHGHNYDNNMKKTKRKSCVTLLSSCISITKCHCAVKAFDKVQHQSHWLVHSPCLYCAVCSIKFFRRKKKGGSVDPEAVAAQRGTFSPTAACTACCEEMSVEMVELSVKATEPVRPAGILQQNRVFLDFFWDLAKPDQEVRLKAVENLIQYLKTNNKVRRLRSLTLRGCL